MVLTSTLEGDSPGALLLGDSDLLYGVGGEGVGGGDQGGLSTEPELVGDVTNLGDASVREGEPVGALHVALTLRAWSARGGNANIIFSLEVVVEVSVTVILTVVPQDGPRPLVLEVLATEVLATELRRGSGNGGEADEQSKVHHVVVGAE